jgi:hypothetical protein
VLAVGAGAGAVVLADGAGVGEVVLADGAGAGVVAAGGAAGAEAAGGVDGVEGELCGVVCAIALVNANPLTAARAMILLSMCCLL